MKNGRSKGKFFYIFSFFFILFTQKSLIFPEKSFILHNLAENPDKKYRKSYITSGENNDFLKGWGGGMIV